MFEIMLGGKKSQYVKTGFIREVTAVDFITGDALASQIGLTAGTSQHSDAGWLMFVDAVDGKTKYISKKPLRYNLNWNHLNSRGAVRGTARVVIAGATYKVRLLSGANSNPSTVGHSSWDHPGTHGCEWNRLLYHISAKPFGHASNTLASEGIVEGDWASYSEIDIGTAMELTGGNGSYQWCQETGTIDDRRIMRGRIGVSYLNQAGMASTFPEYGWRACLELVE